MDSNRSDSPLFHDNNTAQKFLETLGGKFNFRVVPERSDSTVYPQKYRNFDETAFARANAQGAGVFMVVNEGGHNDASIDRIRALFIDLDRKTFPDDKSYQEALRFAKQGRKSESETAPENWPTPSIHVQSGGGDHVYWIVEDMPVDAFRKAQQALATKFKGDPVTVNPSRIMRLPGSLHQKTVNPFPVTLVTCDERRRYKYKDLLAQLEVDLEQVHGEKFKSATPAMWTIGRPLTPDALVELSHALKQLDKLHPEAVNERPHWLRIIASLKAHNWPDDVMEPIAREWSSQSQKFDQQHWAVDWKSLNVEGGITPATLYYLAGKADEDCPPTGTSDGFACRWLAWLDGRAMFSRGRWFAWSGAYWKPDHERIAAWLKEFAREHGRLAHEAFARSPTDARLEKQMKAALKLYDQGVQQKVLAAAATMLHFPAEQLDQDPFLLACSNGTVDLKTGSFKRSDPNDRITLCTGVTFDASAQAPCWNAFIEQALPDRETADWLQRYLGYSATGDVREEVMLITLGPSGTGKTTALKAVMHALGGEVAATSYATSASSALLSDCGKRRNANEHTAGLTPLVGKRLAAVNEVKRGEAWDDSLFKTLISREPIQMRESGGTTAFSVVPTWKVWVRGNYEPQTHDNSTAFFRRVAIVEFRCRPEMANQDLDELLRSEAPGILNYLIKGALDWQKRGLKQSTLMLEAKDAFRSEQDRFGEWLASMTEPGGFTSGAGLRASYAQFAGITQQMADLDFPTAMRDHGYRRSQGRYKGKKARGFKVTLKPNVDDDIYSLV